jgi:hypothetical protein
MWILWTWLAGIAPTAYICFRVWYPSCVKDGDYRKEAVKALQKDSKYGDTFDSDDIEKARIRHCAREMGQLSVFLGVIWPLFLVCSGLYYVYKGLTWPFNRMADKDIKAVDDKAAIRRGEEIAAQHRKSQRESWIKEFGEKDNG